MFENRWDTESSRIYFFLFLRFFFFKDECLIFLGAMFEINSSNGELWVWLNGLFFKRVFWDGFHVNFGAPEDV